MRSPLGSHRLRGAGARLWVALALSSLVGCAVDVGSDTESVTSSTQALQGSQQDRERDRDCDDDDDDGQASRGCKRQRDCPSGQYCDQSDDDHRGKGHDTHDHQHGQSGVCRSLDDGNPCTADGLDKQGEVQHKPVPAGTSCSDKNACNGEEKCDASARCKAGTPPTLADGNPCTLDRCDPTAGVSHPPVSNGTSCADATLCNGLETCQGGVCKPGTPPLIDDANPCTTDGCDPTKGVTHAPKPAGTTCEPQDKCGGEGSCSANGQCQSGAPPNLDDGNPCTVDSCDANGGVRHVPVPSGTSCDDGNLCNGTSACNTSGACLPGTPPVVDDQNPCTVDSCNATNGVTHLPVGAGTPCSDGNTCNGDESCNGDGQCAIAAPPPLDDGNPCTIDTCQPQGGVQHVAAPTGTPCGDSDMCNGNEQCDAAGACRPGPPASLDDGNPCTIDSCVPGSGVAHVAAPAGTQCPDADACNGTEQCSANGQCAAASAPSLDDGNPCTVDACSPTLGVTHTPASAGTSCADTNPCNGNEACDAGGQCRPGQPLSADDQNPCTADSCDPVTGVQHTPLASTASCADADLCNGDEHCDGAGHCKAPAPSQSDDGNPCTIDACSPSSGTTHLPAPVGTPCGNGDACHPAPRCDAVGSCVPAPPSVIDDQNSCTIDACDATHGVTHVPTPGASCGDGNPCNGEDRCNTEGVCTTHPVLPLDDGNPCTLEHCDPTLGFQSTPAPAETPCDDGNACNGSESCNGAGLCLPHLAPSIDDGNPCTADSCDASLGVLHQLVPAGSSCSNGDLCDGDELCDSSGVCRAGTPRCDDGDICNGQESCSPDGSCVPNPAPPLLTISGPSSGLLTRDAAVALSGSVSSLTPASLSVEPGALSLSFTGSSAAQPFSLPLSLVEGQNQFTVVATSQSQCSASQVLSITRDSLPPTLQLDAPSRLAAKEAGHAVVHASDARLTEVRFVVRLHGEVVAQQARSSPPFEFDFSAPPGAHAGETLELSASALDQAGNSAEASTTVTLTSAGIVVGRVISDATGQPLAGASASLNALTTSTRPDGRYSFGVEDQTATVRVWRHGFTSVERRAEIQAGVGSVAIDARLTPLAEPVLVSGNDVTWTTELGRWDGHPVLAALNAPASAFSGAVALHLTPLSPQGLPELLPPGWSPLGAFEARLAAADPAAPEVDPSAAFPALTTPLSMELSGLPEQPLAFVAYDRTDHRWRLLDGFTPSEGKATRALAGLGAFALVMADAASAPALPAPGQPLPGLEPISIPLSATAQAAGVPGTLPAQGGIAQGRILLSGATLPSGTVVSAALSESYTLASGQLACSDAWLQDIILYRARPPQLPGAVGDLAGTLGASFPVATSFSFGLTDVKAGKLHVDVLAGREAHRGKIGGRAGVEVEHAGASLSLPEASLEADTLIDLERTDVSDFVLRSAELVPLTQLSLDFSGMLLSKSAELAIAGLPLAVEETPLLTRIERIDGVAKPNLVALGTYDGSSWSFATGDGLAGVLHEGTYVVYRSTLPPAFVAGTARAASAPVQALVTSNTSPFVTFAALDGSYKLPVRPTAAIDVTASVPGANLIAHASTAVTPNQTASLDLDLIGEVTTLTVTPATGSVAVPRTTQITLQGDTALDPQTVTSDTIRLFKGAPSDNALVPSRLQISANARSIALIPEIRLAEASDYTLQASGLKDAKGGAVVVPITVFRTAVEAAPVVNTDQVDVTLGNDGTAHISSGSGTLTPGTTVLVTNEGNGQITSCSVGNSGGLGCDIPASINDTLTISITTPDGATKTIKHGQYRLADGRTAIGPAGGLVKGPGGAELRIPEGAVKSGSIFEINLIDPATLIARPYLSNGSVSAALQVRVEGNPLLNKEVDLAFPRPSDAPQGSYFYVYKQLLPPVGEELPGGAAFEVIDHAFPEGQGADEKIVTASCPFPGVTDYAERLGLAAQLATLGFPPTYSSAPRGYLFDALGKFVVDKMLGRANKAFLGQSRGPSGNLLSDSIFLLAHTYDALRPSQPAVGLIRGRVLRPVVSASGEAPRYVELPGASVFGCDASGQQFPNTPATVATTRADGTFTLWDNFPTQGNVVICADLTGGPSNLGALCPTPGQPSDTVKCVSAVQEVVATCADNVRFYRNQLKANITFPAIVAAPNTSPAAVQIDVVREANGARETASGLATVGQQLLITFKNTEVEVRSVEVTQQGATQSLPVRRDPLFGQASGADQVADFSPAVAGTFTIRATALPVFGGAPIVRTSTIRVVAAGGSVTAPVPDEPPAILDARTVPPDGSDDVHPSVQPQFVFSEPVKNVPRFVSLQEAQSGALVKCTLVGVGLDNLPIVLNDDAGGAQQIVTALTVQPERQLKFNTDYIVKLDAGIFDLDNTLPGAAAAPHPLAPYTANFKTLQPQALTPPGSGFSSPGIATLGDRAYVVENNFTSGILRVFDISDPASPTELPSLQRQMAGRPMDLDVQDDGQGGANVTVVTGPANTSFPSNVRLYHVPAAAAPSANSTPSLQTDWIAGSTLTSTATEGIVRRVAMKGEFAYALTTFKGIQVVDLTFAQQLFRQGGGDTSRLRIPFNSDGQGFGHEAVVSTVSVLKGPRPAFLTDLQVADLVDGVKQPIVVATGDIGLTLVNPQTAEVLFQGPNGEAWPNPAFRGQALTLTKIDDADIAVVVGRVQASGIQTSYVMYAIDITNPRAPVVRGELANLPADPADVVVTAPTVIVSARTDLGSRVVSASLIDLSLGSPQLIGAVDAIAGRLAMSASGLLLASNGSPDGGDAYLGGIRTATLGTLGLITDLPPTLADATIIGSQIMMTTVGEADLTVRTTGSEAAKEATLELLEVDERLPPRTVGTVPFPLVTARSLGLVSTSGTPLAGLVGKPGSSINTLGTSSAGNFSVDVRIDPFGRIVFGPGLRKLKGTSLQAKLILALPGANVASAPREIQFGEVDIVDKTSGKSLTSCEIPLRCLPTTVDPNQKLQLTAVTTPSTLSRDLSFDWEAPGAVAPIGRGSDYVVQFPAEARSLDQVTPLLKEVRLVATDTVGQSTQPKLLNVGLRELSGPQWCNRFAPAGPSEESMLAELDDNFETYTRNFITALRTASPANSSSTTATVSVRSTYRPAEREYLMYYAWEIANEGLPAHAVPRLWPLPIPADSIAWSHRASSTGDDVPSASKAAAQSMVDCYDMVARASKPRMNSSETELLVDANWALAPASNHSRRLAIDMRVSWTGTLSIFYPENPENPLVAKTPNQPFREVVFPTDPAEVASFPDSSLILRRVGCSYGVSKLLLPKPDVVHWDSFKVRDCDP